MQRKSRRYLEQPSFVSVYNKMIECLLAMALFSGMKGSVCVNSFCCVAATLMPSSRETFIIPKKYRANKYFRKNKGHL